MLNAKVISLSLLLPQAYVWSHNVDLFHSGDSSYPDHIEKSVYGNRDGDSQSIALLSQKTFCEIEALGPILPLCIEGGVSSLDPHIRRKIAAKLSLCEFRVSHVAYPPQCDDIDSEYGLDSCIESLERHPQHWTTFSGNYREVQTICHQQALPYEKHQIVDLFQNITRLYRDFHDEMTSSASTSNEAMDTMRMEFQSMLDTLATIKKQQQQFQQEQSAQSASYSLDLDGIWNKTIKIFDYQQKSHDDTLVATQQGISNLEEMFLALRDSVEASTDGVDTLHTKIAQLVSTWDTESEDMFSHLEELSSFMNSAITDGTWAVDNLNTKLHQSEDMAVSNHHIIEATNSELVQHRNSVAEELNCLLHDFSVNANSHLKDLLLENELEVKRSVDATMQNITQAFENTRDMVNQHGHIIEQLTIKFANTTRVITSAVKKVTTTLPIGAIRGVTKSFNAAWDRIFAIFAVAQYGLKMVLILIMVVLAWTMTRSNTVKISPRRIISTCILFTLQIGILLSAVGGIGAAYAVVTFIESWDDST